MQPQTLSRRALKLLVVRTAAVASVTLLVLTLLSLVGQTYPLELLTHFQVQYLLAALLCTVLLAALRRWRWFAVSLGSLVLAGAAVLPYQAGQTAHAHVGSSGQRTVRLLLANVLLSNTAYQDVLDLVEAEDADVLIFQEVNERWQRALAPIGAAYPHIVERPREDPYGTVVYSRLPIEQVDVLELGEAGRSTVCLRVMVAGTPVSIVCTHPNQPLMPTGFTHRNDQLDRVAEVTAGLPHPLVLAGDLNMSMWSPWFQRLCERTGLRSVRSGMGVQGTWPAALPRCLRLPIDHFLVSGGVSVTGCRLGPSIGSDHLPLIVDLVIP